MIDREGHVKTLEFNCRMGDPETQPILMRLKTDFLEVLLSATEGSGGSSFENLELEWDRRTALGVVLAAHGYPQAPRKGDTISGLPKDADDAMVFHAGTATVDGQIQTSGGRVLCVTALGDSVRQVQQRVYQSLQGIAFDGMQYRTDIGYRAAKG
jgi:phosphoribosylamine--glycine ligase